MDLLSQLLRQTKATRAADEQDGAPRSNVRRALKRFSAAEVEWLQANHATHTATEAGKHLVRCTGSVRKKCLSLGLQLKYEEAMANHTKRGAQKGLGCSLAEK